MTIAAGFKCSDGIILCADTELTEYVAKYNRLKVLPFEKKFLLTGSGDTDYIKMTFDKLCDEFRAAAPQNPSDARDIVERTVYEVHEKHIFAFYQATDPNRPQMNLIVGARCENDELVLIKTCDTATLIGGPYESVGSGKHLCQYWASYVFRNELTMDLMSYLSMFIIREIKNHVPGCGGSTCVYWLPKDRNAPQTSRIVDEKLILAEFPESIAAVLSECRDLSVPDAAIDATLNAFVKKVRDLRLTEKQAVRGRELMREAEQAQGGGPKTGSDENVER